MECLSGIPGSTGATPIQNVGAYGQQVSDTIVSVRAYDRTLRRQIDLKPEHCSFAYRSSRFRHTMRYMVLAVTFALEPSRLAAPIRYPELARTLGVAQGARPPPFNALERRVAERLSSDARPPAWPHETGAVKTSAAWLIERAGFHRGYGTGRVGISRKHTLALVNRGGASTTQLIALAREIRDHVQEVFGVELHPEPTLVGVEL